MLFQLNLFQLPLIVIPAVLYLLWRKRKEDPKSGSLSPVGLSVAIVGALSIWMALVGPFPFYRYIVAATALSSIIVAYGIDQSARLIFRVKEVRRLAPSVAAATLLVTITNVISWPGAVIFPEKFRLTYYLSSVVRPEIRLLIDDLTDDGEKDPNRSAVEFLRQRLEPGDEILCNYEDIPLMFYLKHKVRGGFACFRVTDAGNVRFAVYRKSVALCHPAVYLREMQKSRWRPFVLDGIDIRWGNFPDPRAHYALLAGGSSPLVILERVTDNDQEVE
jgi:hypothetical protein